MQTTRSHGSEQRELAVLAPIILQLLDRNPALAARERETEQSGAISGVGCDHCVTIDFWFFSHFPAEFSA